MKARWEKTHDTQGANTLEFAFERDDSRLVTGAVWQADVGIHKPGMIAFGHGASGDRYQMPIPFLAGRFAKLGFTCLSIDGPVHGLRQKGPGGRAALAEEMKSRSMFDDMVEDWHASIDCVVEKTDTVPDVFGYFGLSMGSIFGIPFLASRVRRHEPVTAAVLGLLGTTGAVTRLAERLLADASNINCPILFLMQLEDELFPRDGYLELFDALGSVDKRIHANPGMHPEVPAEEMSFTTQFLSSRLSEQLQGLLDEQSSAAS